MAPRLYVCVSLLVLLASAACSPTAPTAAPPAGILVVEELGVRSYAAPDSATPSYEPWAILRETTGTHAVTIQSVIVTVTGTQGATIVHSGSCISQRRVEAGGTWTFESLGIYCGDVLPTPLPAFTVEIAYSDTSNNRLGGIVRGSWAPTP